MKLRAFFFDKGVFRKDVTRFAPLWALYFLGGLLVMLSTLESYSYRNAAEFLGESIALFSPVNLIYAIFAAQLLFGDLFNSRLCNALHALPLRRETWFCTHVLSGLAFSVVPHAAASLLFMLFLRQFWFLAPLWVLGMLLQYLFFFGLAVLCMLCTGNRFAAVAVYAIVNFFSLIVWWFVNTVYIPQLYGIRLLEDSFTLFSPVVRLCAYGDDIFLFHHPASSYSSFTAYFSGLGKGWIYMAVLAVLGIGCLALALVIYRKRKLESAGDFVAVPGLGPAFSVVYTLCVAAVFAMFGDLMMDTYVVFFIFGLAVGFFTGQMLLERTVKVFQMKNLARLGILSGALILSLVLTVIDPLGLTRWVPEPANVAAVQVGQSSYLNDDDYTLTQEEDIRDVLDLHNAILAQGPATEVYDLTTVTLSYRLKSGREVRRQYSVYLTEEMTEKIVKVFSNPRQVLGYTDWEDFLANVYRIELDFFGDLPVAKHAQFLEALKADCEAGNMAQIWRLHDGAYNTIGCRIYFQKDYASPYIVIFHEAENTLRWLEDSDLIYDELKDKFGLK